MNQLRPLRLTNLISRAGATASRLTSSDAATPQINIPRRIPRSPTDILHALSATIGTDPTAAHYKYHDDPYLIPTSNISKRTYAMSQEAGRKAAIWIRQQHPELFQHQSAQPPIAAFQPQLIYTEETIGDIAELSVESLHETIAQVRVTDAALVYRTLVAKGVTIPAEVRQQLLELLCFHNHEDTLSAELTEERWHAQSSAGRERQRKTWHDNGLAEELFAGLEPPTAESYAALIRGMCKHCQVERAWSLFEEAGERGLQLDVATYNAVIGVANFLREGGEMRWELVQDLLRRMAAAKLRPDAQTLNAVMSTVATIGGYRQGRVYALQTLAEFRALGIRPTLATWYHVLAIFCRERGPVSHVLADLLPHIEADGGDAGALRIGNAKDTFFFVTAMDVCRNHVGDKDLALRVDRLLHAGNNYDLIGDSYKESIYYRHLFGLLVNTEPLAVFMERTYDRLVPHVYTPEPGIMAELLRQVDVNGALELVPRLWSDMVQFNHVRRESLLQQVLRIMVDNRPGRAEELPAHAGLEERFAAIGWQIWELFEGREGEAEMRDASRTNQMTWTGQMLGDVLQLAVRSGDWQRAGLVFEKLDREAHRVAGTPAGAAIEAYVAMCREQRQPSRALLALQYHVDKGLGDSVAVARALVAEMTLDEGHLAKVAALVGGEVLKARVK